MSTSNPFKDDWRDCLRAHYRFVLALGDVANEASLHHVLHDIGVNEDDLALLRAEAVAGTDSDSDSVPEEMPAEVADETPEGDESMRYHIDPESERRALEALEAQLAPLAKAEAEPPAPEAALPVEPDMPVTEADVDSVPPEAPPPPPHEDRTPPKQLSLFDF